jgi:hypothetical protein
VSNRRIEKSRDTLPRFAQCISDVRSGIPKTRERDTSYRLPHLHSNSRHGVRASGTKGHSMQLRISPCVVFAAAACLLAGCTHIGERADTKSALLSAAGFHVVEPADSRALYPDRLPPGRIVETQEEGKAIFLYDDPYLCGCVLKGDRKAFDRYHVEQFQRDFHAAGGVPAAF